MTTLATIRTKVRRLTGSPSTAALSNSDIDDAVNTFYLYDLPEHLRLWNYKDVYTFVTEPDVDTYTISANDYYTVTPPVYVAGSQIAYSQSRAQFYQQWPQISFQEDADTGDGATVTFSLTMSNTPILQNTFLLGSVNAAGDAISVTDDGDGTLSGDGSGTINYETGAVSVTFTSAPGDDENLNAQYFAYTASQPVACLYFNNEMILRPVPDQAYIVSMEVYKTPTALADSVDSPLYNELWQCLAYGGSTKILEDRGDFNRLPQVTNMLKNSMILLGRRKAVQISSQRAATIFSANSLGVGANALWPYGNF